MSTLREKSQLTIPVEMPRYVNKNKAVGAVYLNFFKAFYMFPQSNLRAKLVK